MRSVFDLAVHDALDLGEFVHQAAFGMKPACRVDDHHVEVATPGRLQRIESHGGGVGTMLLLDHRHVRALGPDVELFDGCGAERVGSAQKHGVPGLLVAVGQLADGGGLAYAINTHHHNDVRLLGQRRVEVSGTLGRVVEQEPGHLVADDGVEFFGRDVGVLGHMRFDELDDLERGRDADVAGDEDLFEGVEGVFIDGVLAAHEPVELSEKAGPGFFESLFEPRLIGRPFRRLESIKKSHLVWISTVYCRAYLRVGARYARVARPG